MLRLFDLHACSMQHGGVMTIAAAKKGEELMSITNERQEQQFETASRQLVSAAREAPAC